VRVVVTRVCARGVHDRRECDACSCARANVHGRQCQVACWNTSALARYHWEGDMGGAPRTSCPRRCIEFTEGQRTEPAQLCSHDIVEGHKATSLCLNSKAIVFFPSNGKGRGRSAAASLQWLAARVAVLGVCAHVTCRAVCGFFCIRSRSGPVARPVTACTVCPGLASGRARTNPPTHRVSVCRPCTRHPQRGA
jgi:hypothetical protein